MGKKIVRAIGSAVCVLLFLLCVFMLIISAVFGSAKIIDVFGYNLYLCGESSYAGLENGSAVIVEQCEPYDLEKGNLILYNSAAGSEKVVPALAYFEQAEMKDGVYYITISDSEDNISGINGSALVGRASWSSPAFGVIIRFSLSPWGICVMAVLPCLALIVYSIIKTAVDNAPPPEVIPQRKNTDKQTPISTLGLNADGNAQYSRKGSTKANTTADGVLFTYGKPKSPAVMKPSAPAEEPVRTAPEKKPVAAGAVPSSVAARRYIDNATAAQRKPASIPSEDKSFFDSPSPTEEKPAPRVTADSANDRLDAVLSGATSELPAVGRKKKSDAFFVQSDAPQIGRGMARGSANRAVIDLEDALATASAKESKRNADTAGRRSSSILAAKSRSELISDDDDSRDRSRYDVDDILSGIDSRRRK